VSFEEARSIADAVLYEGYALYPYRASSPKNRVRFPFGCVYPAAYARAQTGFDRSELHTECLLRADAAATLQVRVRCLVLARPAVARAPGSWQETLEKRLDFTLPLAAGATREPFELEGVPGALVVSRESVGPGLVKLRVGVENSSPLDAVERDAALEQAFLSLNLLLRVTGGTFVSRVDPPAELSELGAALEGEGLFPVLVGAPGDARSMLASPIILYDYPAVAAASPGDLFDATEIDEILSLRIQTLTPGEKDAMRELDPRVRAVLERTEALGAGELGRLHGELKAAAPTLLGPFSPGTRVRLRPKRRADIFDLALAGRVATVRSLECDAEGAAYLCVTVDDDPGADLGVSGQPGHRFFFDPDEVELLGDGEGAP
jgi:hypothetical protein